MGLIADEALLNVTDTLKRHRMWKNTLVVVISDNGGPAGKTAPKSDSNGANNYPLRGGKTSLFEGGIRTPGFVSGGFVPVYARGQRRTGFVHLADWCVVVEGQQVSQRVSE